MAPTKNLSWVFTKIPTGEPVDGENFKIEDRPIDLSSPPPSGGLLIEILYTSIDPYMRGRMRDSKIKSYSPAYPLNEPITAYSLARVLKSGNPDWREGDIFFGVATVQQYAVVEESLLPLWKPEKISNPYDLDLKEFVGALGMPGLTAYSSLYEIGKPKKGETIFISSAAGAVGQIVGQIAKHEGLKVIGSVGSDEKLNFILKDLGFDSGFNYKKEKPADALVRLAPDGIDIYYENVGGEHLEAAIDALNRDGRIVASGMVSQYNKSLPEAYGVRNLYRMISYRLLMQGFIVGDKNFGQKYGAEHQKNVQKWLKDGSIKAVTDLSEGIETAGACFVKMMQGKNFGKAAVKIKVVGPSAHL